MVKSILKNDTSEFTELIKELDNLNPTLCQIYKNRITGAVETLKLVNKNESK